uniref:Uncharacterized protein n=1 Tax=viral metagenome TaxID=1070528 RepID=A0A6C0BEA9_9ZZZZ
MPMNVNRASITIFDMKTYLLKLIVSKNKIITDIKIKNNFICKLNDDVNRLIKNHSKHISENSERILQLLLRVDKFIMDIKQEIKTLQKTIEDKKYFITNIRTYINNKRLTNWISIRWIKYCIIM